MIETIHGLQALMIPKEEIINPNASGRSAESVNQSGAVYNSNPIRTDKKNDAINKLNYSQLTDKIKADLNVKDLAIQFSMDKDTKMMIMRLIDNDTKEVIRQFPPEIALKIARIVASQTDNGVVADAKV